MIHVDEEWNQGAADNSSYIISDERIMKIKQCEI